MKNLETFCFSVLMLFFIINPTLDAQVIKDDFRVNDDTTGGIHLSADVEIIESGEAIVVWEDGRNGEQNIYGQAYDNSGASIGANFKVSTHTGNYYESTPAVSSYGDSLLVIWGNGYGQWLLSDGSQSGSSFSLGSENVFSPDVAVSDSGFFVAWDDSVPGGAYEIFIKRFNFNGDSIGPRIIINDDGIVANQYKPRIAMDKKGNFVVVWYDFRNGSYSDIYGQRFGPSGNSIGGNFLINDSVDTRNQQNFSCAMDSAGNFVIVWDDYRDGINPNIYGQRFDSLGDTLGGNFHINDDVGLTDKYDPSCAIDLSGNFVVVWGDYREGPGNIYAQRFDTEGDTIGANFRINEGIGSEAKYTPKVSMNEDNFIVTWKDPRNSTSIYMRRFENGGTPTGSEVKVNELNGTKNQIRPALDMNAAGNVVATWHDSREPFGIYFQRLDTLGNTLGENSWVNYGYNPDVAVSPDSRFFITYYYMNNVYYKRFSSTGDSIGSSTTITDTISIGQRYYPVIDIDSDNNAVIAWHDSRTGYPDIYAQMVDSAGDTIGGNFKVNNDEGLTTYQAMPAIALSPSGKFLIAWHDYRNGEYDIYGQLYGSDGSPVGTNFRIDSGSIYSQTYPDIGYHPDGNFIVVWQDNRGPPGIYAQIIDTTGALVDTNFKVSNSYGYSPQVSVAPSGAFVVTWSEDKFGQDIYAQRYNADYSPDSTNFKVNNETEGINPDQLEPDVATNGRNMIFAWQDPKWQRGYDIAAKVLVAWGLSSVKEEESASISTMLLPNLTNPFVNSTTIRYQIGSRQNFSIKIFDLSGRLVNPLIEGSAEPGLYSLTWDGKDKNGHDVPVGIYFCRLATKNKTQAIKMMLLR